MEEQTQLKPILIPMYFLVLSKMILVKVVIYQTKEVVSNELIEF